MWLVIVVWAVPSALAAIGLLALQPLLGLSMEFLSLVMLAPAVGALACLLTVREHLPEFGERATAGRFAAAIGLSVAVVVFYFIAMALLQGRPPQVPATVAGLPVALMLLAQAVGALTEEIGFRGVLFHALGARMAPLLASVVVGLLFGAWHVQYFALPFAEHAAFIAATVVLNVTMTTVMTGSFWQRMTVCTIIHLGANLALAFTGGENPSMTDFALVIVAGSLIAIPVAVVRGRRDRAAAGA